MQLSSILLFSAASLAAQIESYPKLDDGTTIETFPLYHAEDQIALECSKRQIDTGEHFFNEKGDIIYIPFMDCQETKKPLELKYNVDEQIACTVKFEDRLYHLFQLYLHQDAPFTCRIPVRPDSGLYIPLDIQVRGNIMESHFDLDPNIAIQMFTDGDGTIISSTSFSTSVNTTRIIIGDTVKLNFNVIWTSLKKIVPEIPEQAQTTQSKLEQQKYITSYILPDRRNQKVLYFFTAVIGALIGSVVTTVFLYKRLNRKLRQSYSDKLE